MRVEEIMTRGVKTAGPNTPVRDIATQMVLHHIFNF